MDRFDEWAKELLPCSCGLTHPQWCPTYHGYDCKCGVANGVHVRDCVSYFQLAVAAAPRSASHRQETEGGTKALISESQLSITEIVERVVKKFHTCICGVGSHYANCCADGSGLTRNACLEAAYAVISLCKLRAAHLHRYFPDGEIGTIKLDSSRHDAGECKRLGGACVLDDLEVK